MDALFADNAIPAGRWIAQHAERLIVTRAQVLEAASDKPLLPLDEYARRGVYFLVKNEEVVYIGQTGNWSARQNSHLKARRKWDRLFFLDVNHSMARPAIEWAYIDVAEPAWNVAVRPSYLDEAHDLRDRLRGGWQ